MTPDRALDMNNANSMRPSFVIVVPWDLHYVGGVNETVVNLYREAHLSGEMQSIIMVIQWSAFRPIERVIEGRRIVYLRLWPPWSERGFAWFLKWIITSPLFLTDLWRFCRRHRVVAFNFQFPSPTAFSIALLRFLRLYRGALILSFQGADLRHARESGAVDRILWRFLLHNATAVVGCSSSFAADVREFTGTLAGGVHAIPNGLDVAYFKSSMDPTAKLPEPLCNREFILSVAAFEQKKGLDVLLRAFAEIRRTHPNLALVLVGKSSDAEPDLRALASELSIADDVFFFGNVPHRQVGHFLQHAKAFCLPSRIEPFGIAILEAGAHNLPVVASRVGGIPEIITHGETGLLVAPDDVTGLAVALDRVLSDPKFAQVLGESLYRRVVSDFSWDQAYKKYRALLSQT